LVQNIPIASSSKDATLRKKGDHVGGREQASGEGSPAGKSGDILLTFDSSKALRSSKIENEPIGTRLKKI